ncbi:hypothetical protein SRB5_57300 [Streptomyces sp. RB5]|uniref:Bacterial bifunctional deaminase-reductase C-terminal domain-containing protein n=1 Tax=Streptomyces smaragdinus TaxID=2585196 RepID=A0A7K0CPZ9_9ACTN|nr:pyrimidine reductase family protein [Streptomyces smaragdinus]MQY15547.1 hypothetical protein [Streptomyces smaragdinus]
MRRLFPPYAGPQSDDRVTPDREWELGELADAYAYPADAGFWLRANMVSSLDGAAHHDGRSQPLSGAGDMRIFGVLRGLADVVLVGAETVRQEGYRPARTRDAFAARRRELGQTPAPAIAVLSAGLNLDFTLPLFTEPLTPTIVLTGEDAPADRVAAARAAGADVVVAGPDGGAEAAGVVAALRERGLTRVLTEGGPTVLASLTAGGVLDELCLTLAPRVTLGDAPRVMTGAAAYAVPREFTLVSLLEEAGFLFSRYRRI